MKFEIGKLYKTRDGRKAQIFMLDIGTGSMLGAIQLSVTIKSGTIEHPEKSEWLADSWYWNGLKSLGNRVVCDKDLVSEWRDPVKYSVELWASGPLSPNPESVHIHNYIFGNKIGWDRKKLGQSHIKYRVTVEEIPNDL